MAREQVHTKNAIDTRSNITKTTHTHTRDHLSHNFNNIQDDSLYLTKRICTEKKDQIILQKKSNETTTKTEVLVDEHPCCFY